MRNENKHHTDAEPERQDAVARLLRVLTVVASSKKSVVHPSYQRLLDAAAKLRGIHGEAALTAALHSTDQQKINNWQRRGVSKDGALEAERYIGCPATWILDGRHPPGTEWKTRTTLQAEQPAPGYGRPEQRELLDLTAEIDSESVRALILLLKTLHPELPRKKPGQ
jgi:hypothetical protein